MPVTFSLHPDHHHLFPATHKPSAPALSSYGDAILCNDPSSSTRTLHCYQYTTHPAHAAMCGSRDPCIAHHLQLIVSPTSEDTPQVAHVARALNMCQSPPPLNADPKVVNSTANLID